MNWSLFWGAFAGIMVGPTPLIALFVIMDRRDSKRHQEIMRGEYHVGKYITDIFHSDWTEEQLDALWVKQETQ